MKPSSNKRSIDFLFKDSCRFKGNKVLLLDGAMGTELKRRGTLVYDAPIDVIRQIHLEYISVGSEIILTNTFDVGFGKAKSKAEFERKIENALLAANMAREEAKRKGIICDRQVFVALDLGPHKSKDNYSKTVVEALKYDFDLIFIETAMNLKSAIEALEAVKAVQNENAYEFPIFVSATVDEKGTLGGESILEFVKVAEEKGASAVGINCSFGIENMTRSKVIRQMKSATKLPIICKPNVNCESRIDPSEFSFKMKELIEQGANIVGGCCGTDYRYIKAMYEMFHKECNLK